MQIITKTAGIPATGLKDKDMNILIGAGYFQRLHRRYSSMDNPVKFALAGYLVGENNLDSMIKLHDVMGWKDIEGLINDGITRRLQDSNDTDVVYYTNKIIKNYFSLKELETQKNSIAQSK